MARGRASLVDGLLRAVRRWWARVRTPESAAKRLGRLGEREAWRYLRARGYRLLGRNVRVPMGEADLVCETPDGAGVVVVEVKSRARGVSERSDAIPPEAAVTPEKRRRLHAIAAHLRKCNGWQERPVRVDVVAVEFDAQGRATLRHHEGRAG